MKKKVLASLLAVCMMVGFTVPALAEYGYSSQSGLDEEITELEFNTKELSVKQDEQKDLNDYLTAYCGDSKIAQNPVIEYSIIGEESLGVGLNGSSVSAYDRSGSITVQAKASATGKTATIKVTAAPKTATVSATGFKFKDASKNIITTDTSVVLVATPSGAVFTDAQIAAINSKLGFTVKQGNTVINTITSTVDGINPDKNEITVKLAGFPLVSQGSPVNYTLQTNTFALPQPSHATNTYTITPRSTRISTVVEVKATRIVRTGTITMQVGEVKDIDKYVQITSGANSEDHKDYALTLYNENSDVSDYVVQDSSDPNLIKAIAVGRQKVIVTLDQAANTPSVEVDIVVTPRTKTSDSSISVSTGSIKVGETMTIKAQNIANGQEVSWSVDNGKVATVTMKGNETVVKGLAAGTATVTAKVGDAIIGTATITVLASGSTGTVPPTSNPGTGDNWFSNLF